MIARIVGSRQVRTCAVALAWALVASQAFAAPPPVPEIDPGSAGSVMAVVFGALALLERRRS